MKQFYLLTFLVLVGFGMMAQSVSEIVVDRQYTKAPLEQVLEQLQNSYPIRFYYQDSWVKDVQVNGSFQTDLSNFLQQILAGSGITFQVFRGQQIILMKAEPAQPVTSDVAVDPLGAPLEQVLVIGNGENAKGTISGYIREANTGEAIIGASIYVEEIGNGTITNNFGFYSLTLPTGVYHITISYIGWEDEKITLDLRGSGSHDFEMFQETVRLEGVTVTDRQQDANISSVQMSTAKLDITTIKQRPAFLGEVDVIKSIQLLPGVSTVGEGARGFNVRGGGVGDNLVLLDGAPVFNSSHLFGFFSIFNPDVVKDATLYKGSIPAKYGDRIASVLDVNLKEGNTKNWNAKGGVGLVSSRISAEGPIIKDRGSLVIGARASYSDWVLDHVRDIEIRRSAAAFYDANIKLNHQFDDKNKLSLTGYYSRDRFRFAADTLYRYQNALASLSWKHIFKDQWFSNLTAVFSNYDYQVEGLEEGFLYRLKSGIQYAGLRLDLSYFPNLKHKMDFGLTFGHYDLQPGELIPLEANSLLESLMVQDENSLEASAYWSDEFVVNPKLTVLAGLRYSWYRQLGPGRDFIYNPEVPLSPSSVIDTLNFAKGENITTYQGIEPRLSVKYSLNDQSSLKLSYQRMRQNLHLISNSAAITPFDTWKSSDRFLPPQISDQLSLGYFRNFNDNTWEGSVELYYRLIDQVPQYKNQAEILLNPMLETDLIVGEGRTYGAEFLLQKDFGRLNGWISYTLSRTERKADGQFAEEKINRGEFYLADFDRTHDFTNVMSYKISRRWLFSSNFTFSTGRPISVPVNRYRLFGVSIAQFSDRNTFRIPDYHRLDLSITLEGNHRKNKKWEGSWTFTVFNVYSRRNAYSIFFGTEGESRVINAFKLSVLGSAFPALTYNFKFSK